MKKEWKIPELEVLNIRMTMKGMFDPPGHSNAPGKGHGYDNGNGPGKGHAYGHNHGLDS